MKSLIIIIVSMMTLSIVSCGNKNAESKVTNDSTMVDSAVVDTIVVDSVK